MEALTEVIIGGIKKYSMEIVAGILFAVTFWVFPSLRKLFRKNEASDEEVKQQLEQLRETLQQITKKDNSEEARRKQLEVLQQEEQQLLRLKETPNRHDEALRLTGTQTVELQRQFEEQSNVQQVSQQTARQLYKQGKIYYYDRNYSDAFTCFLLAAQQGHVKAQYFIGEMYRLGKGVPQDKSEARKWYEKASAQGHEDAKRAFRRLK